MDAEIGPDYRPSLQRCAVSRSDGLCRGRRGQLTEVKDNWSPLRYSLGMGQSAGLAGALGAASRLKWA